MRRLLFLALLGFLSVFISGKGVDNEKDQYLGDPEVDENSEIEKTEDVHSVEKREAGAKRKHGRKTNSSRNRKRKNKKDKKNKSKKRRNGIKKKRQRKGKPKGRNKKSNRSKKKTRKGYRRKRKNNKKSKFKKSGNQNKKNRRKRKQNKEKKKIKIRNQKNRKRQNEDGKRKRSKGKGRVDKNKKNKKKTANSDKNARKSQRVLNCSDCVVTLAKYSKIYEGKSGAVIRQYKRIQSFEKIRLAKLNKKGSFNSTYNSLLDALGGEKSSLHCDGQTIGSNSSNSTKAYEEALETLGSCESTIISKCPSLLNTEKNDELKNCYDTSKEFRKSFSQCLNTSKYSTQEGICYCVERVSTADYETLKKCDIQKDSQQQKAQKTKCVTKFMACKQAQDLTVEGQDTCRRPYKCGGALNPKDAKEQLELAIKIKAALDATELCHSPAMAALGLTAGAGDDGVVPSNKAQVLVGRQARQTAELGCKELEKLWEGFNKSADATAQKFSDSLKSGPAANTTEFLAKICARNLTADLASCAKETRQITGTLTILIVRIRIYIFWCRQWLILIELKITIITATFGLSAPSPPSPPTSAPAPAPPTATKRTARRVNEFLKNLKSKL